MLEVQQFQNFVCFMVRYPQSFPQRRWKIPAKSKVKRQKEKVNSKEKQFSRILFSLLAFAFLLLP
jgi:hypothetical protein